MIILCSYIVIWGITVYDEISGGEKQMKMKSIEESYFPDFALLVLVNVVLLAIGFRLYNGYFNFTDYPISELGAVRTRTGLLNSSSRRVFSIQMLFNTLFMLHMGNQFFRDNSRLHRGYQFFARTTAVGTLIIILPYDINNFIHSIGTGTMAASILMLTSLGAHEAKIRYAERGPIILNVIAWIILIIYALSNALDLQAKQIIQKPTLAMLGITLLTVTPYMEKQAVSQKQETVVQSGQGRNP